jgi:hypothetical protein
MQQAFNGRDIANQRIETERRDRTGFLDLSQLGLTELPEALLGLTHLRRLHLGRRMVQRDRVWEQDWESADPPNRFGGLDRMAALRDLTSLSIDGLDCDSLGFVARLTALQSLDCSDTPLMRKTSAAR